MLTRETKFTSNPVLSHWESSSEMLTPKSSGKWFSIRSVLLSKICSHFLSFRFAMFHLSGQYTRLGTDVNAPSTGNSHERNPLTMFSVVSKLLLPNPTHQVQAGWLHVWLLQQKSIGSDNRMLKFTLLHNKATQLQVHRNEDRQSSRGSIFCLHYTSNPKMRKTRKIHAWAPPQAAPPEKWFRKWVLVEDEWQEERLLSLQFYRKPRAISYHKDVANWVFHGLKLAGQLTTILILLRVNSPASRVGLGKFSGRPFQSREILQIQEVNIVKLGSIPS